MRLGCPLELHETDKLPNNWEAVLVGHAQLAILLKDGTITILSRAEFDRALEVAEANCKPWMFDWYQEYHFGKW